MTPSEHRLGGCSPNAFPPRLRTRQGVCSLPVTTHRSPSQSSCARTEHKRYTKRGKRKITFVDVILRVENPEDPTKNHSAELQDKKIDSENSAALLHSNNKQPKTEIRKRLRVFKTESEHPFASTSVNFHMCVYLRAFQVSFLKLVSSMKMIPFKIA